MLDIKIYIGILNMVKEKKDCWIYEVLKLIIYL